MPRLVADDITPEAAASLLAEQGGRLAVLSAEGGIFTTLAGPLLRRPQPRGVPQGPRPETCSASTARAAPPSTSNAPH